MRRKLCIALVIIVLASACNDGGSPTSSSTSSNPPAPPPSTPSPSQAQITVSISDGVVTSTAGGNTFEFLLMMRESAGVRASINFVRLELFTATGAFEERAEIGASFITAAVGDNKLDANSTESARVTLFFRSTIKKGRSMLLTVSFTDALGNRLMATFPYVFS